MSPRFVSLRDALGAEAWLAEVARTPWLAHLEAAELVALLVRGDERAVAAGTEIIRIGTPSDGVFVLIDGEVEIRIPIDGEEVVVNRMGPGQALGEQPVRAASVRAVELVRLLHLPLAVVGPVLATAADAVATELRGYRLTHLVRRLRAGDGAAVGALAGGLREEHVLAGARFIEEGALADAAFVVLDGIASAQRVVDGRVVVLARRGPGQCIGEAALLSGGVRACDMRAETDLRLLRIDAETFRNWYRGSTALRAELGAMRQLYAQPNGGLVTLHDADGDRVSAVQTAPDGSRHVAAMRDDHLHLVTDDRDADQVLRWERAPAGVRKELHLRDGSVVGIVAHRDDPELLTLSRLTLAHARVTAAQQTRFRWTGQLVHAGGSGIVCPCVGVTVDDVGGLKASGVVDLQTIAERTGATRICGRCGPGIDAIPAGAAPTERPRPAGLTGLARVVTAEDLDRCLATLDHGRPDEDGFFDLDGSAAQTAEIALLAAGGRATLMQFAWPAVGQSLLDHSDVTHDPSGRFHRTMANSYRLQFGTKTTALRTARRLHAIHLAATGVFPVDVGRHRAGDTYQANQIESLKWVAATLIETKMVWRALVYGPPSAEATAQSMRNLRTFCALFGISDLDVWRDEAALRAWMAAQEAEGALAVTPAVRALGHRLLEAPRPALRPLYAVVRAVTIGMLPEAIARLFGWTPSRRHRAAVALVVRSTRAAHRVLPPGLRYAQAYNEALVRTRRAAALPWGSGWLEAGLEAGLRRGEGPAG